jgi:hypothetical protein
MKCPLVTRFLCHTARDFYIEKHMNRFVKTLLNKEYRQVMNISYKDALKEITFLYDKRRNIQRFDHVCNGIRQKKMSVPFKLNLE